MSTIKDLSSGPCQCQVLELKSNSDSSAWTTESLHVSRHQKCKKNTKNKDLLEARNAGGGLGGFSKYYFSTL